MDRAQMSHLAINDLSVCYGSQTVLKDINIAVEHGEMLALLGPSGCGKTTLLNTLCGFTAANSGKISVAGRDITHLSPEARNITMVFQSYALWPHMTVEQNIAFGLSLRGYDKTHSRKQVMKMLEAVNLKEVERKKVTELSGGQRQRVALARALAVEPDILLLDEPLSNLDAKVRLSVRDEIKQLQQQLGFTSIIVTHDQEEAQVMADRIAVLHQGHIEQVGTPEEIYYHPNTAFVADFMGADNHLDPVSLSNISVDFRKDGRSIQLPVHLQQLYFRSEHAVVMPLTSELPDHGLVLSGEVTRSVFLTGQYQTVVNVNGFLCHARCKEELNLHEKVQVHVEPRHLFSF